MSKEKNGSDISRKTFLKTAATGAAVLGGVGVLAGCTSKNPASADGSEVAASKNLTPGIYSATKKGRNADIKVNTIISKDAIIAIDIPAHQETAQFGKVCLSEMSKMLIDTQSTAVDAYTGATITSMALVGAVKDCLKQAGDSSAFDTAPTYNKVSETLKADVVVVGSGISGQAAALSAAQSGAKTIMLEKLNVYGGAACGSGGAILAANSPVQKQIGGVTDTALLEEHLYYFSEQKASKDMISHIVSNSAGIIEWYMSVGVQFEVGQTNGSTYQFSHRVKDNSGVKVGTNGNGQMIFDKTRSAFYAAGGTSLLDTKATELLQDSSGAIIGIKASSDTKDYTINCKAVILAAGGYEGDAKLLERFSPHCGPQMVDALCHVGDHGEGILMGINAGGYFNGAGYGQTTFLYSPIPAIKVTKAGKRYSNEMHSEQIRDLYSQFKAFYDSGSQWTYTLFDSTTTNPAAKKTIDAAIAAADANGVITDPSGFTMSPHLYKGNTIEEVAKAAGVDAAGLKATVDNFNKMVAAGVDTEFGTAKIADYGTYTDGPFYLLSFTMMINGTIGGLKIDKQSRVLKEDGSVIKGLYGAGETANGDYMYRLYPSGGASLLFGSVTGRIAGADAAKLA